MKLNKILLLFWVFFVGVASPTYATDMGCPDSKILGPKLIDGICWSCMMPMKIMGAKIGTGTVPSGSTSKILCACKDGLGVPRFGYTSGLWNPARVIEVVRNPWCSPTLGGRKLMNNYRLMGGAEKSDLDSTDSDFRSVHFIAFPLLQILEMLFSTQCNPEGYVEIDVISMSEVDPTHNDPELDFLMNPFGTLLADVTNITMGAALCAKETAGIESDVDFWWNGCLGALLPMTGVVNDEISPGRDTTQAGMKYLSKMHMLGLSRKTFGDDAMCGGEIFPMLPKSGLRLSRLFPHSEASGKCCHTTGASTFTWGGEWRNIPGVSEYTYMLWRYTDCCMN